MSGHYATLLRGTVQAMAREHDVYITDWSDARDIPIAMGRFDFDDFVDYIIDYINFLGPNTHVIAVCQPAVPVLVATALLATRNAEVQPASLTLMGGPIDTRRNPTKVNDLAAARSIDWFERNVVSTVPFPHAGCLRPVYPGFMQLTGFMTMNLERHMNAHVDLFNNLVKGDCDSVTAPGILRRVYGRYGSDGRVLSADGQDGSTGSFPARPHALSPWRVRRLFGDPQNGLDDRRRRTRRHLRLGADGSGAGSLHESPATEKVHYVQPGVGHYGVFNGTRWRTEIQPRIREFIRTVDHRRKFTDQGVVTFTDARKKANGRLNGTGAHVVPVAGE